MAHHQHGRERLLRRQRGQFFWRQAQPVHAGIDMQRRRAALRSLPGGDLRQTAQHRDQIVGDQRRCGIARGAIENEDTRLGVERPQRHAFFQPRHEEAVAIQRRQHTGQTKAITIRLHHRRNLRLRRQLAHQRQVGRQCGPVHPDFATAHRQFRCCGTAV